MNRFGGRQNLRVGVMCFVAGIVPSIAIHVLLKTQTWPDVIPIKLRQVYFLLVGGLCLGATCLLAVGLLAPNLTEQKHKKVLSRWKVYFGSAFLSLLTTSCIAAFVFVSLRGNATPDFWRIWTCVAVMAIACSCLFVQLAASDIHQPVVDFCIVATTNVSVLFGTWATLLSRLA